MLPENFLHHRYILASKSPRRQFLMKELGFDFEIIIKDVEETYPAHLKREEIALFLCELKARAFDLSEFKPGDILITADTIVWHEGQVLGKPVDAVDAFDILSRLAGSRHEVVTAICLKSRERQHSFYDVSEVWFKPMSPKQLNYYIEHFRPFDKAGAYGVQEWIGYVGVERIEGSFFNVMGFPTHRFYEELEKFLTL
jgi:septum formation protein